MVLRLFTIEEKISALHVELVEARRARRDSGSQAQRHFEILKSIADDLRGRAGIADGAALQYLQDAINRMFRSKTALGYDEGQMIAVATALISKWPAVRQALESFEEEEHHEHR